MAIINNTPHAINVISPTDCHFDSTIRKWVASSDVTPQVVLESAGMLNAKIETKDAPSLDDIPMFDKEIVACDPIPDDGNFHVVSALYASAARKMGYDTSRLLLVADPVMSEDGKTFIGCRGLTGIF